MATCKALMTSNANLYAMSDILMQGRGVLEHVANIYELFGHKVRRQEGKNPWRRWWDDSKRWGAFSDILNNPSDALEFLPLHWHYQMTGQSGGHGLVTIQSHFVPAAELRALRKKGEFFIFRAQGLDMAGCILTCAVWAEVKRQTLASKGKKSWLRSKAATRNVDYASAT